MSKAIDSTKALFRGIKNGASKFTASVIEGSRIMPSKNKDHKLPLRIDAGKYDPVTKMLNVVLQVNSKPQSQGLQAWLKKFSTHAKLATAKFNTAAADQQAEYHRVLDELAVKGKQNLRGMEAAGGGWMLGGMESSYNVVAGAKCRGLRFSYMYSLHICWLPARDVSFSMMEP